MKRVEGVYLPKHGRALHISGWAFQTRQDHSRSARSAPASLPGFLLDHFHRIINVLFDFGVNLIGEPVGSATTASGVFHAN